MKCRGKAQAGAIQCCSSTWRPTKPLMEWKPCAGGDLAWEKADASQQVRFLCAHLGVCHSPRHQISKKKTTRKLLQFNAAVAVPMILACMLPPPEMMGKDVSPLHLPQEERKCFRASHSLGCAVFSAFKIVAFLKAKNEIDTQLFV
jgi:hypothetical protein